MNLCEIEVGITSGKILGVAYFLLILRYQAVFVPGKAAEVVMVAEFGVGGFG